VRDVLRRAQGPHHHPVWSRVRVRANLLTQMRKPTCPICRTAIQQTNKVFHS
jgi:hypothetical protein